VEIEVHPCSVQYAVLLFKILCCHGRLVWNYYSTAFDVPGLPVYLPGCDSVPRTITAWRLQALGRPLSSDHPDTYPGALVLGIAYSLDAGVTELGLKV
jgi:hypothetical protein